MVCSQYTNPLLIKRLKEIEEDVQKRMKDPNRPMPPEPDPSIRGIIVRG